MKLNSLTQKKGVMNQVIGIFVLVLVVSVIAGMTFLFTSALKNNIAATASDGNASMAWNAVNTTEAAGNTVVSYLSLLFLALIFGAILVVTLRVILPFINLSGQMGGGF